MKRSDDSQGAGVLKKLMSLICIAAIFSLAGSAAGQSNTVYQKQPDIRVRRSRKSTFILMAAVIFFALVMADASARIVQFTHEGNGSGTLNGNPFLISDFIITATVDTDNREYVCEGVWSIDHSWAVISIEGVGDFEFLTGTRTFVNNNNQAVGFSRGGGEGYDLFDGPYDAQFASWDMQDPIGPISGLGDLMQWDSSPINTTGGILEFNYGSCNATFTAVHEPLSLVHNPIPADDSLLDDTWVILSWTPGQKAVSHNVYLGESFDDVNSGTAEAFRGNQASTYYIAGLPGFAYSNGLAPSTTYYWRIDEVNNTDPNSPWKGPVWSFSIPPLKAYDPAPSDGAKFIDATAATLSWTAGLGAKLHTVYFGENYDTVTNAAGGLPQGTTTFNTQALKLGTTYYWRVDEFDGAAMHKGDVWNFTTIPTIPPEPKYSGGTGEPNNPYQIATAADLIVLGETPDDYDKHFILTADIDLDPNLPGGKVFDKAVIAPDTNDATWLFEGTSFTGVFDGNDHTISHLLVVGVGYLGLFGELATGAEVKNLGVLDVNISSSDSVAGGLVGHNSGTMTFCYSTGTISGDDYVGGLVGYNNTGAISLCYSTGNVTGTISVGGLIGWNESGTVAQCYSTGAVTGGYDVGGLVGENYGDVNNCYSTSAVTGDLGVGGLVGKNEVNQFFRFDNYADLGNINDEINHNLNGWEHVGSWGESSSGDSTARCQLIGEDNFLEFSIPQTDIPYVLTAEIVDGTCEDNFEIYINGIGPIYSYISNQNDGITIVTHQVVIPAEYISDFQMEINFKSTSSDFGCSSSATYYGRSPTYNVKLTLQDGKVGNDYGSITNCYAIGSVTGTISVGGLIGWNESGTVAQCYSSGAVTGGYNVGGFVGENYGDVNNCYSIGVVTGDLGVGGLVGYNSGDLTQCYSTSVVSGTRWGVGGLVGFNWGLDSTITSSFWDVETSGRTNMCGSQSNDATGCNDLFGLTTVEMQTASSFIDAGWDSMYETANGTEDIWWIDDGKDYPRLAWELSIEEIVINIDKDFEYVPHGFPLGLSVSQTSAVGLSTKPYEALRKEPEYRSGQVLYGYIPLGNSNDPKISFVVDEDSSNKNALVLYVDTNNNEDITDDGPPRVNEGTGKLATQISLNVEVISASGETIVRPYHIWFWLSNSRIPYFYTLCHYKGKISIGEEQYTAIAFEFIKHDALYQESGLWIDIDRDGKLDEDREFDKSEEHFEDGAAISIIKGIQYILRLNYP